MRDNTEAKVIDALDEIIRSDPRVAMNALVGATVWMARACDMTRGELDAVMSVLLDVQGFTDERDA